MVSDLPSLRCVSVFVHGLTLAVFVWDSLTVHHWQPILCSIETGPEDSRYLIDIVPIIQLEREDVAEIALGPNPLEVGQLGDIWKGLHGAHL